MSSLLAAAKGRQTPPLPPSGTACNGTHDGTFKGNLTVSAGQNCIFIGGGVTGNVQQNGGNLELLESAEVGGNLQITGASTFTTCPGVVIKGNLQVQNLPAGTVQNQICGSDVQGNLQFQNSGTALLIGASSACAGNTVGGNLQDNNNTAPTQVFDNTINGNLQCQNNTSITGGGNTASKKQGQCATF